MTRLILSDLDGTYLHDDKTCSFTELNRLIDDLARKGIRFGIASARPVGSLRSFFGDLLDRMVVVCANGCILMIDGKIAHRADLTMEDAHYLLKVLSQIDNVEILLDGVRGMYYSSDHPGFFASMRKYGFPGVRLDDLYDAFRIDEIYRMGIYDAVDPLTHGIPALEPVTDRFLLLPSGDEWLDIIKKGEDKGNCVKRLQEMLGISPEETMCFGDYYNDIPLFEHCRESWAMKNAPDEVKEYTRHVTRYDNNEDGVIRTIREILL